jgi:hypothetical protein
MHLDGPNAGARDAVHVIFAGEKVREEYPEPVPNVEPFEVIQSAKTLPLESLVRMKLTSFRRKDQVHILDMISIGLINEPGVSGIRRSWHRDSRNCWMILTVDSGRPHSSTAP